ncbi:MAG: MvdC/MvdD family ATP grasp protein [Bacteroidota bacterium]
MTALLLTHSNDYFNIDRVMAALEQMGTPCIRFNTDRFPEDIHISEKIDDQGIEVVVKGPDFQFSSREIGAVWSRKIWHPIIHTPMEDAYKQAAMRESTAVLRALFGALSHCKWLDPLAAMNKAEDKFLQLRYARQAGLRLPKTIITNDPEAVRKFYNSLKGEMICKMHTPLSVGMQHNQFFFYTTKINDEAIEELDMLSLCPMIFQERIPKAYELRVAYVDGQCFSGKIQSAHLTDWRQGNPASMKWESYQLPEDCKEKIRKFMQLIGLSYGAIDLIRQTDGSYIFLEVNPGGEWGMLEKELSLPIAQTIATGLTQRIKSHFSIPQNQPS